MVICHLVNGLKTLKTNKMETLYYAVITLASITGAFILFLLFALAHSMILFLVMVIREKQGEKYNNGKIGEYYCMNYLNYRIKVENHLDSMVFFGLL
jgi:hypothetical protein